MYELKQKILVATGSASHFPNNLSIYFHGAEDLTLACMVHKNQVGTLSWDQSLDCFAYDSLLAKQNDLSALVFVLQAKYCMPSRRTYPLLVVATSKGAMVYDAKSSKLLAWSSVDDSPELPGREQTHRFTKGITCVGNLVAVGSHSGALLIFSCSNENSVNFKRSVQEHKFAIADLATCRSDDLTCSCDVSGNVVVWTKNLKNSQKKFSTGQEINCINVLRKQLIIGTFTGQLLFYSTLDGQLLAEVNAHIRQINAIAVAPENAHVLSVSDDTTIHLWKIYAHKSETYKVEWQYNEKIENIPLVGAQFVNGRGSAFVVSGYDCSKLLYYQIAKTSSTM